MKVGLKRGSSVLLLLVAFTQVHAANAGTEIPPRSPGITLPVQPYKPSSEASAPRAAVLPANSQWEVRTSDITIAKTFERWAVDAGYKLKWDASRNFLVGASDVYFGSFESAIQAVLSSSGIRNSDYPLEACIYANSPPLLRVTRQGEQSRDCGTSD